MVKGMDNRTLYIHDNLDILRGMNSESVDLIATDPPFNKGRDFHATPDSLAAGARFQDRWSWEADVHPDWVDSIKDDQPALYELIDLVKNGQRRDDLAAFLCWLGVRVIEMRRVLKPTGSLYLHCDPTASHYIKTLLDGVFGAQNFRNEIVWKRAYGGKISQHKPKRWGATHDTILFYAKSEAVRVAPYKPAKEEWLAKRFDLIDADGKRYHDNGELERRPSQGARPNLCYEFKGFTPKHKAGWRISRENMQAEWDAGRVLIKDGKLIRRVYEHEHKGYPAGTTWDDIPFLTSSNTEKVGYPTQKPVALYKRIIAASSNEGDLVLDPFCGCATTLIAAETLNRHWIGIDLWEHAAETLQQRIGFPVHARREPPVRTDDEADVGVSLPSINRRQRRAEPWMRLSHADMRDILYAAQDGVCAGCGRELHIRFMQLDHMQPRAEGGANTIDNRVMLCSPCNGAKGAILTISGLVRVNKRDGWLEDEGRRKIAYARARLVGEAAGENESEALIRLVGELQIDEERKAAIERTLAPLRELAFGV